MQEHMNGTFTHPEAFSDVLTEFRRLHAKHPDTDGTTLWALARDYAWTLALAQTFSLKVELGLQ